MTDYHYLIATPEHIPAIEALQAENLVSNLSEDQQKDGFVTTPFTREQLLDAIENHGIFLCANNDEIVAYLVCASWQYFSKWPIFAHMVTLFPALTYCGETPTIDNSYQYGPICIAEAHRGKGILQGIFPFARTEMNKRYPYAITFVNKRNPRSYAAHIRKLGLDEISTFQFNDQEYWMLGFPTKAKAEAA